MLRRTLLLLIAVHLLSPAVRVDARPSHAARPLPAGAIHHLAHEGQVGIAVYAPNGKTLASTGEGRVILWDAATGRQLWQRKLDNRLAPRNLAFAPDGKTLAGCGDFGWLIFWDAATGAATEISPKRFGAGDWWELVFSPDGRSLATGGSRGELSLWDGRTGKHLRSLEARPLQISQVAFAPDSKTLVVSSLNNHQLTFWDPATGKLLRTFADGGNALEKTSYSPDGTYLVVRTPGLALQLWDWETKKEFRTIAGAPRGVCVYSYAFSPDGHTIAVAQWNVHTLLLYETATGLERARFTGHTDRVSTVSFAAHGRAFASAGLDRSVFVWDVTGRWQNGKWPAPKLSAAELARLWSDLGSEQADKAYRAVWTLALSPEQSVPFLGNKFFFGDSPSAKELARRIAELEDDVQAIREDAFAELQRLGPAAHGALRQATPRLPEARARIQLLLNPKRAAQMPPSKRLQLARGLEALELAATPLARRILEDLTAPIRDDWIAEEARAALKRLPHS